MHNGSTFLRISDYVLIEYLYKTDQFLESAQPFNNYFNNHEGSNTIVNRINSKSITGNTEDLLFVATNGIEKAIIDVNNGYYYPNNDSNIVPSDVSANAGILTYDTVRVHIRSGYNFQDNQGFLLNLYLEDVLGNKFSLLSQSYLKRDLSSIKFNRIPVRVSDVAYDKYVEYKILNSEDIISEGAPNSSFVRSIVDIKNNPLIFLEFNIIDTVDISSGYMKLITSIKEETYVPLSDNYSNLTASLTEKESYFEYFAKWDEESIENTIYLLNSRSGNDFVLEHEVSLYVQYGNEFALLESFTRTQTSNYNIPLKYRPVLDNNVDGSIQIEYTLRLFNRANGVSITKESSVNSLNVNRYTKEPFRIQVDGIQPIKVYNKIVKKEISNVNIPKPFEQKIILPLYYENNKVFIDGEVFTIKIVPFDNIYQLDLVKEVKGQEIPYSIELNVSHYLVFKENGENIIRIKEHETSEKGNGILRFLITKENSEKILKFTTDSFFINAYEEGNYETNLATGNFMDKSKVVEVPEMPTIVLPETIRTSSETESVIPTIIPPTPVVTTINIDSKGGNEFVQVETTVIKPAIETESTANIIPIIELPIELPNIAEVINSSNLFRDRILKKYTVNSNNRIWGLIGSNKSKFNSTSVKRRGFFDFN